MLPETFVFYAPMRVIYGPGTCRQVGAAVRQAVPKGAKCAVVIDAKIKSDPALTGLLQSLEAEGLSRIEFDVTKEPDDADVAALGRFLAEGRPDAVVAVGGGSAIDLAKAGNVAMTNPGPIVDYEGLNKVTRPGKPLFAVPTTAGTGSEMGHGSVLVDRRRRTKFVVVSEYLYPTASILDPELTLGLPPLPTAASGMDALAHAMGSMAVTVSQPMTRPFALYAIQLIRANLPAALEDGRNVKARQGMLLGSGVAGLAMYSADCAIEHVFGEVVGGYYGVPHGVAMARFLPYSIRVNAPVRPEAYAAMFEAFTGRAAPEGERLAGEFEREVRRFVAGLGLPALTHYGCAVKDIPDLVERALQHVCYPISSAELGPEQIDAIYREAFSE